MSDLLIIVAAWVLLWLLVAVMACGPRRRGVISFTGRPKNMTPPHGRCSTLPGGTVPDTPRPPAPPPPPKVER